MTALSACSERPDARTASLAVRTIVYLAILALPAIVVVVTSASWPRWLFMWVLVGAIYGSMKLLTFVDASDIEAVAWRRWAYLFLWPGLNAKEFLAESHARKRTEANLVEWQEGLVNFVVGAALFWTTGRWIGSAHPLIVGWAGMAGTILMLHFGAFQLLSCGWRYFGVDARPLMNHPTRATSVARFWGNGWNTAFRDVAHTFVFRPLTLQFGPTTALVVGFLFSGLVHELAVSVPARGGYGGPTVYFCIQAAAILFERSAVGRAIGVGHGLRGWLFTAAVLLLPVRLLFHDPFVLRIVLPFMQACGAA